MWSPFEIFPAVFPRKSMGSQQGGPKDSLWFLGGLEMVYPKIQLQHGVFAASPQKRKVMGAGCKGHILQTFHAKILLGFKNGPFSVNPCRQENLFFSAGQCSMLCLPILAANTLQTLMPKFCWDFWMDLFQPASFESKAEFLQHTVLLRGKEFPIGGMQAHVEHSFCSVHLMIQEIA